MGPSQRTRNNVCAGAQKMRQPSAGDPIGILRRLLCGHNCSGSGEPVPRRPTDHYPVRIESMVQLVASWLITLSAAECRRRRRTSTLISHTMFFLPSNVVCTVIQWSESPLRVLCFWFRQARRGAFP